MALWKGKRNARCHGGSHCRKQQPLLQSREQREKTGIIRMWRGGPIQLKLRTLKGKYFMTGSGFLEWGTMRLALRLLENRQPEFSYGRGEDPCCCTKEALPMCDIHRNHRQTVIHRKQTGRSKSHLLLEPCSHPTNLLVEFYLEPTNHVEMWTEEPQLQSQKAESRRWVWSWNTDTIT